MDRIMESIRETQKKYCSRAMVIAIGIGLIFILAGQKPVGKGLILGALFSVVNFVLIGETLPLKFGKSRGKTFILSLVSILFRYVLLAVPIVLAIKLERFNVVSVILGIFMIQFVILSEHIVTSITSTRRKQI